MARWKTKGICLLAVLSVAGANASDTDSLRDARRDKALKRIETCLRRSEVSSRECKNLNEDVGMLVDVYRQGDRSVFRTLLRFTYLTEFYGNALTSDPDFFLTEVARLPEAGQQAVAAGIAGGMFGLKRDKFDAVRAALQKVPKTSPVYQLARSCLHRLETENASYLANYFPPQTFRDFTLHWYSREMYSLGLKPLWPPNPDSQRTFRITVLPAFSPPESVTLMVMPDDTGKVEFRTTDTANLHAIVDSTTTVNPRQVADFTSALARIEFWLMPTEKPTSGCDGAEWILEAVKGSQYHVVDRWCPGSSPFGRVARELFKLAGHKSKGGC